jgi:hypothetical protein
MSCTGNPADGLRTNGGGIHRDRVLHRVYLEDSHGKGQNNRARKADLRRVLLRADVREERDDVAVLMLDQLSLALNVHHPCTIPSSPEPGANRQPSIHVLVLLNYTVFL